MSFIKEDTRKLQETDLTTFTHVHRCKTYIYRYRFERHDRVTNKMIIRICYNTKNKIRHTWFRWNVHLVRNKLTTQNTGNHRKSLLEELGRWLDDRFTLSDKELPAVAYVSDKETEEHDLEKLGKDNG